ncbi:MAG: hypothetical protein ACKOQY_02425 [Bacteroidota bacterium]
MIKTADVHVKCQNVQACLKKFGFAGAKRAAIAVLIHFVGKC